MILPAAPNNRRPEIVGIEITRACNLTCPHCFTAAGRRPAAELSTAQLRSLIDQLVVLGPPRAIGWTGGEPLLRDDLEELAAHANSAGAIVSGITTNGVLLDSDRAKRLRDAGTYAVQISIDGSTSDQFVKMRNGSGEDFAKIIAAMKSVKHHGMQLHLAMLLCKDTLHDARAFLRFAADHGADGVRFCGFVPAGRGRNDKVRQRMEFDDAAALREFVAEAQECTQLLVMFDPAFGPLPPANCFHECVAGVKTMYVASDGSVFPCTSLIDKRFCVGNIKTRPLANIWADECMTEVAHFDRNSVEGHCRGCAHFDTCQGACRGIVHANTGDLKSPFPHCLVQDAVADRCPTTPQS